MIPTSPWPDVAVPGLPFSDFPFVNLSQWAERPAFIDGPNGQTLSHGRGHRLASQVAGAVAARGPAKGDVFALVLPDCPEYAVAFNGVALAAGLPEDVAQAALWRASDGSRFDNGHALVVDGGLTRGRSWSDSQHRRTDLRAASKIDG